MTSIGQIYGLNTLDILATSVTDDGVKQLANLQQLQQLYLLDTAHHR